MTRSAAPAPPRGAGLGRPLTGAVLLGLGLGGFVDGIVLHQILQWHNMLSSVRPPVDMESMRYNMTFDGLFHAATWMVTALGIAIIAAAVALLLIARRK